MATSAGKSVSKGAKGSKGTAAGRASKQGKVRGASTVSSKKVAKGRGPGLPSQRS